MIVLDKIKAFFKYWVYWPKPEAKGEKKASEAPEKKEDKGSSKWKNGPCRGKPGCWGFPP